MSADILTSPRGKAMLANCPKYYETSRVFKSYLQAVGPELDQFKQGVKEILDQWFARTASWGLDRWEEELGLVNYVGKPDKQRQDRIVSKIRGVGMVTIQLVKAACEAYDGGAVEVTEQPELYQFTVKFVDTYGIPPNLEDLKNAIEDIKPAHLAVSYNFRYLLWDDFDVQSITWDQLDAKVLAWNDFETGGWLNA
ncbi:phage-like element pbsx protein XkdT [Desulfocucumis palustris]|uniref:Phage-like element pbsx protein XkdT n=1 Tax=Desulfocucumis palustris TaxID=1898651 RepID=A0A2L2XMC9_9FIRM|nr:putative phage tail protein [Desulfocucumis palustris]GBF35486.1 phage-like element pbsx protein XkdT [Desulfocucumis palustris]